MIQIICKSESYTYNAYHILKAFYPSQEVSCKTDEKASNYVMVHLPDDREISVGFENTVEITDTAGRDESTGKIQEDSEKESQKKERKRQIDLSLYDQLERITGEPLAWGVLTGVRPTKLAMQKLEAGWKKEDYINWAWKSARVRGEKAALAWEIAVIKRFNMDVVFAIVNEKAVMIPVKVITYYGLNAAIMADGLVEGMQIVTKGNERVFPDMPVQVFNNTQTK